MGSSGKHRPFDLPFHLPPLTARRSSRYLFNALTVPNSNRKIPWRLSVPQKRRQRKRLRLVDNVVAVVDAALKRNMKETIPNLERWKAEMPTEEEMRPKDKYTMFDRKEKNYRKGVHSEYCGLLRVCVAVCAKVFGADLLVTQLELPKWTRVSQRINPPGF